MYTTFRSRDFIFVEEARFERANYIEFDLQSNAFGHFATPPYLVGDFIPDPIVAYLSTSASIAATS